jgi:tetratricopeptide (TPR) repeat protein/transglutaminase-like putative cysteine protease
MRLATRKGIWAAAVTVLLSSCQAHVGPPASSPPANGVPGKSAVAKSAPTEGGGRRTADGGKLAKSAPTEGGARRTADGGKLAKSAPTEGGGRRTADGGKLAKSAPTKCVPAKNALAGKPPTKDVPASSGPAKTDPVASLPGASLPAVILADKSPPAASPLGKIPSAEIWEQPLFSADSAAIARAAAALPLPKDADLETFFDDTRERLDAAGRCYRTHRRIYRFVTRHSVEEESYVQVVWSPWHEARPTVRARVITADGKEHRLDPQLLAEETVENNSPLMWSDERTLRAPLPATDVGAVVETELAIEETQPFFPQGVVRHNVLGSIDPVHKARLTIEAPKGLTLRHVERGTELQPRRSERDGIVKLVYETAPKRWKFPEPYAPPDHCWFPDIIYATGKSWHDVATAYAAMVERQLEKAGVDSLVHEEIGLEKDRRAIAVKLLAAAQRMVRYTGIEFGKASIVPRTPREVLVRRFGDCKDQAALLVAMLRAAGLQADVVLLSAGTGADVVPELPGMGGFNHAIVCMGGDPPLWIDPTIHCLAAGRLPRADQGRWALPARRDVTQLVRTPVDRYQENTHTQTCELLPDEHGKGPARVTLELTGSFADGCRDLCASSHQGDLRRVWEAYGRAMFHSRKLRGWGYRNLENLDKPFNVFLEIQDASIGKEEGAELHVKLDATPLIGQLPAMFNKGLSHRGDAGDEDSPYSKRKSPMVLPQPHIFRLTYLVTVPPWYIAAPLPRDSVQHFGPVTISQHYTLSAANGVRAKFELDTGPGLLAPAEVDALRDGLLKMISDQENARWDVPLVFREMVTEYSRRGWYKEMLERSRRLVTTYPKSGEARRTLAMALLSAGLGDAAREQARLAVAAEPKSAAMHALLGDALSRDSLGRWYYPGMDWAGAAAAYRKSLELAPDDGLVRARYGQLLTFGSDGVLLAADAKLEEGIGQLKQAMKDAKQRSLIAPRLANALFIAGRYAEIRVMAAEWPQWTSWPELLLAATTDEKGSKAAQQQSMEFYHDAGQRTRALSKAVASLRFSRRYAAAIDLAEAISSEGDKASPLENSPATLRHFEKVDFQFDRPANDPEELVRRFVTAVICNGHGERDPARFFVEGTSAEDISALGDGVLSIAADHKHTSTVAMVVEDQCRARGFSILQVADWMSVTAVQSEGDDETGYRVRVSDRPTMYVVKQADGYRLVAPGPQQVNVGQMALRCLEHGNPEMAKRWLDWIVEEQKSGGGPVDRFEGAPVASLWPGIYRDNPQNKSISVAIAAVMAERLPPPVMLSMLQEERTRSPSPLQSLQIDRALVRAYDSAGRFEDALALVERLRQYYTGEPELIAGRITALWMLGRNPTEGDWLRVQLRNSTNPALWEYVALLAARVGDFKAADETLARLMEARLISPAGLNGFAWNSIFLRKANQAALDAALKANDLLKNDNPSCLNTLAAVYAEMGRAVEAHLTLRRCVAARGNRIADNDWYVLGRIAEDYGLDDVAADLYRKVKRPKRPWADDAYNLAQWRLKTVTSSIWWRWLAPLFPDINAPRPPAKAAKVSASPPPSRSPEKK